MFWSFFGIWSLEFGISSLQSVMPTYEYVCEKCGHQFEKVQSMSAKPLTICPQELCRQTRWGKGKVKRAISGGAGLIFKGSGFYITDYRSDKYKEAAKKDSTAPATSGDKSSGNSEAKPAAAKSRVDTTGFASPPVVTVDAPRVMTVAP